MTRDETVALFLECEAKRAEAQQAAINEGKSEDEAREIAHEAARECWNAWAEDMLAKRKALEKSGTWAVEQVKPKNAETRAWMEEADANFSRCLFLLKGGENFQEEPRDIIGDTVLPIKSIAIDGSYADFSGFIFPGNARFVRATFSCAASFFSTTFSGYTSFASATFSGSTSFDSTTFLGNASFAGTTFSSYVFFRSATFSGNVLLLSATFTKSTSFRDAKFGTVEKKAEADFTAIKVERAFDLSGASFSKVPCFSQADFKQAPDLDGVLFPLPPAEPLRSADGSLIPKYRALRRMAIQSADYDREQRAFKGEMRSRRWTVDKFWHPEGFFGWCYDWAADCGRSIIRPFAIWLLSVFVFAVLYLPAGKNALSPCVSGSGSVFVKSLYISGRNALVLSSGGKDDRIDASLSVPLRSKRSEFAAEHPRRRQLRRVLRAGAA